MQKANKSYFKFGIMEKKIKPLTQYWVTFISVLMVTSATAGFYYAVAATGGGGAGPDVYYYPAGKTDTDFASSTSGGWSGHTFSYGCKITPGASGTCTSIGAKLNNSAGTTDYKIAVYDDADDSLVASGTITGVASGAGAWHDATVSFSSGTGTYYVMVSAADADGWINYDSGGSHYFDDVVYASFPADPASPSAEATTFGVRMYVD